MKLDIKKEREKLSTRYKKLWDIQASMIDRVAEEMDLSSSEKEAMIQMEMATTRYADLKEQNEYNRKSGDVFARRAIKRNEAEMNRMDRIHRDNSDLIEASKAEVVKDKVTSLTDKEIERLNNLSKSRKQ